MHSTFKPVTVKYAFGGRDQLYQFDVVCDQYRLIDEIIPMYDGDYNLRTGAHHRHVTPDFEVYVKTEVVDDTIIAAGVSDAVSEERKRCANIASSFYRGGKITSRQTKAMNAQCIEIRKRILSGD